MPTAFGRKAQILKFDLVAMWSCDRCYEVSSLTGIVQAPSRTTEYEVWRLTDKRPHGVEQSSTARRLRRPAPRCLDGVFGPWTGTLGARSRIPVAASSWPDSNLNLTHIPLKLQTSNTMRQTTNNRSHWRRLNGLSYCAFVLWFRRLIGFTFSVQCFRDQNR